MGYEQEITEQLAEHIMLPACGQGALAIECRSEDHEVQALIAPLNDPLTAVCVHTERHVNALLGGNCHVPLAVFCTPQDASQLNLRAKILNHDGSQIIYNQQIGTIEESSFLAIQCAQSLLDQGGAALLASIPK